ncbi:MAG: hypothetical protein HC854_13265 [Flavobacterium sp.]|nr:hypothetical protein [Flavobacterium sp.]
MPENFETSFPPSGWNTFTNGVGNGQNWGITTNAALIYPDGGLQSAFVNRENIGAGNTSEDWLVTPAISITAASQIRFLLDNCFLEMQELLIN